MFIFKNDKYALAREIFKGHSYNEKGEGTRVLSVRRRTQVPSSSNKQASPKKVRLLPHVIQGSAFR